MYKLSTCLTIIYYLIYSHIYETYCIMRKSCLLQLIYLVVSFIEHLLIASNELQQTLFFHNVSYIIA
jgi:hypothetical protein